MRNGCSRREWKLQTGKNIIRGRVNREEGSRMRRVKEKMRRKKKRKKCPRGESNPHAIAGIRPWNARVYQFRHPGNFSEQWRYEFPLFTQSIDSSKKFPLPFHHCAFVPLPRLNRPIKDRKNGRINPPANHFIYETPNHSVSPRITPKSCSHAQIYPHDCLLKWPISARTRG